MKKFYVVDYVDDEGDQVIKHTLMTPEEAAELVEAMAKSGSKGSVIDITGQKEPPPVMSEHDTEESPPRLPC